MSEYGRNRPFFGFILFLIIVTLSLRTKGFFGGADNYNHYRIATDVFRFPDLFFDLWGKPVFIAIMSIPSQFGVGAIKVMNAIFAFTTALLVKKTADNVGLKNTNLLLVFTLFAPLYTALAGSALTEILFSFVLVYGIYLFSQERFTLGAIVISFLPFARLEGFGVLLLILGFLLYRKQWKAMPLILFGTIFISLLGLTIHDSPFWIIKEWPHPADSFDTYGKGDLMHFVSSIPDILGWPIAVCFYLGLIKVFGKGIPKNKRDLLIYLMLSIVILYISAHSYLWWKGKGGSAGFTRVLGGIIPLMSLVGLMGWNLIADRFLKAKFLRNIVQLTLSVVLIFYAIISYDLPEKLHPFEEALVRALKWHEENVGKENEIYYFDDIVFNFTKYDFGDRLRYGLPNPNQANLGLDNNRVLIWTTASEGKMPLSVFENNEFVKALKIFQPIFDDPKTPNYYRIYLFTAGSRMSFSNELCSMDFDEVGSFEIDTTTFPDKKGVCFLNKEHLYSPTFSGTYGQLNLGGVKELSIDVEFFTDHELEPSEFSLIGAIERDEQMHFYKAYSPDSIEYQVNQWNKMGMTLPVANLESNDKISWYVWYQGKGDGNIWIDNLIGRIPGAAISNEVYSVDFDEIGDFNEKQVDKKTFPDKNGVYLLNKDYIYSPTFSTTYDQLGLENINELVMNVEFFTDHDLGSSEFLLTGAVERDGNMHVYKTLSSGDINYEQGMWNTVKMALPLTDPQPQDKISIYIWYQDQGEEQIWIDNMKVRGR
ncbi:MAG: hypothetical protein MRY83_23940 [Flavobacteriales bacterium]|nr:hypothetical protein [Flavobacteriales bacterium]